MVQQGLSVPPPLRRGGGQRISTALSIPPSGRTATNPVPAHKGPPNPRKVRRRKVISEDTDSDGYGSGSDAEYGKPRAKRAKIGSKVKAHTPTPSTSESEEETASSVRSSIKRERTYSSNGDYSDEDRSEKGDEMDGEEVVAAGAGFLNLVDDLPTMGNIAPEPSKSLIVRLPAKKAIKPEGSNLGRNDLDNLAAAASGLPTNNGTSSIGTYPGLDLSLQNHRQYSQADHAHSTSGYLSAGYGGIDGLPEPSLYGSMISLPHISYPNGFEHFDTTNSEDQGVVEDGWDLANSDYQSRGFIGSCASTTPRSLNAHGMPTITRHPRSSLSHLSTSFMLKPAVQEDTVGGEYYSPGLSTIDHTPSSNLPEDSANVPWLTRDGSSTGQTTGMDFDNVDNVDTVQSSDMATLHQQYDGYSDGNVYF